MFEITESASEKYVHVRLTGKLTKEAYAEFLPMTERLIQERGKLRMMVVMHDFHGWDIGGAWEDSKFAVKHFRDLERVAIVGERPWEKWMTVFCRPFTRAKMKYFDSANLAEARHWLEQDRIPLHHVLLADQGILVLAPDGPLAESDFKEVASEVDPFIAEHGKLSGLMVDARAFPGWMNFASMMAHFRFVRDHHRHIHRVAVVSDDNVLSHLPSFASHFVSAELKHFPHDEKDQAFAWLAGTQTPSA